MLARVLLHVIEPAGPVDLPTHLVPRRKGRLDNVRNAAVGEIDDPGNANAVQHAGVEWLTAGRRIERRAIEDNSRAAVDVEDVSDAGGESGQVRVGVVKALCH